MAIVMTAVVLLGALATYLATTRPCVSGHHRHRHLRQTGRRGLP